MKRESGIYVEIPIQATMDDLWEHTQNPELHQQWDLRFTSIQYLPKEDDSQAQKFLYSTRIGFGLQITGEGESVGTWQSSAGETSSALKFWSEEPLSLISSGSGYWKYIPDGENVRFLTWYDYDVRFGKIGRWIDRAAFRPLIAWGTAWSFDTLRLWLEKNIAPQVSIRRTKVHYLIQLTLALLWIYQGLVPKLLFPDSGEIEILAALGLFANREIIVLTIIGFAEILFGILFLLPAVGRRLHYANILLLILLDVGALGSQPAIFVAPFNPATLNFAMIMLSIISLINNDDLPSAGNCLRRPPER